MKARTIGRAIGTMSLAFGIFDMVRGKQLGKAVGAEGRAGSLLFRGAGAREVATGIAGLLLPTSTAPVQWRIAGDVADLAALSWLTAPSNPRRKSAVLGLGIVAAVTVADLLALRSLRRVQ